MNQHVQFLHMYPLRQAHPYQIYSSGAWRQPSGRHRTTPPSPLGEPHRVVHIANRYGHVRPIGLIKNDLGSQRLLTIVAQNPNRHAFLLVPSRPPKTFFREGCPQKIIEEKATEAARRERPVNRILCARAASRQSDAHGSLFPAMHETPPNVSVPWHKQRFRTQREPPSRFNIS